MKTMLDKGSTLNLPKLDFCVFYQSSNVEFGFKILLELYHNLEW